MFFKILRRVIEVSFEQMDTPIGLLTMSNIIIYYTYFVKVNYT